MKTIGADFYTINYFNLIRLVTVLTPNTCIDKVGL